MVLSRDFIDQAPTVDKTPQRHDSGLSSNPSLLKWREACLNKDERSLLAAE